MCGALFKKLKLKTTIVRAWTRDEENMSDHDEIKFNLVKREDYTLVQFDLENIISPDSLKSLAPPKVDGRKGVVLSGRGPIWLYCYLTHFYHPTKFIAVYDPRISGGVIVESHTPNHSVGDVIKVDIE